MKLFGPRGITVVNLPVWHGESRIQAPVAYAYELIRLGFKQNFRYKDLVGAQIAVSDHAIRVTRAHLENIREGLEQVGVLESYGQGLPVRIMTYGPVLPIVSNGQHDWKHWTLPHDPETSDGPYRPITVNYTRKFEGTLEKRSRLKINQPRKSN